MKLSNALQNGSFLHKKTQNLELVNLKFLTYAQPIPLTYKRATGVAQYKHEQYQGSNSVPRHMSNIYIYKIPAPGDSQLTCIRLAPVNKPPFLHCFVTEISPFHQITPKDLATFARLITILR